MNNYDKIIDEWRQKALEFDYKERYEALSLPGYNDKNLPITYFGVQYEIDRADAKIYMVSNQDSEISFGTAMAIYHLFYYSIKSPCNSNNFVPLRDVKRAGPFSEAFKNQTLIPFARAFDGKKEELIKAGERIGFQRLTYSDAGFQAMAFECMPIRFLFWDGDNEFPAQANVLFDAKITDFMHEETVIMIAGDGLHRLIEAAK